MTLGHLAAERLSHERSEALRRQLEEQEERLRSRQAAIVERHPGVVRKKSGSFGEKVDVVGGCLEVFVEIPFRLLFKLFELLLQVLGGLLEGLADL